MKPRNALILVAASSLLLVASRRSDIEAADGDTMGNLAGGLSLEALANNAETAVNVLTERSADVDETTAQKNINAGLVALMQSEGTAKWPDPYRVCFGEKHTISDLSEHPAVTGEWMGELLPDDMCKNAGFGPGCKSTAAGAFQINRVTWLDVRNKEGLTDFSPESQAQAAIHLIARCGALEDLKAGRFSEFVRKCRGRWASLPGNQAKQGQRSYAQLSTWFAQAGGIEVA